MPAEAYRLLPSILLDSCILPAVCSPNESVSMKKKLYVSSHAFLDALPLRLRWMKGLEYIFLDMGFHLFGPAQYLFFASTLYLFGDHIPPIHNYTASNKEEMPPIGVGTDDSWFGHFLRGKRGFFYVVTNAFLHVLPILCV